MTHGHHSDPADPAPSSHRPGRTIDSNPPFIYKWIGRDSTYHRIRRFFLSYLRLFHSIEYVGLENLPRRGPALVAANHVSYYDPLLVGCPFTENRLRFMAWQALFTGGFFDHLIRAGGAFPVNTEGRDMGGFREAHEQLKNGEIVGIFPEGERSYDGRLLPFREGVGRLALLANAPITPVCIQGASRAWPRGDSFPRPWNKIKVTFMPAIQPPPYKTPAERKEAAQEMTRRLREAILECLAGPGPADR